MPDSSYQLPPLAGSLALSFVSLGIVCLVAYWSLRWLARRGLGQSRGGAMEVVARCTLEPKRSLYVVKTAGRCFLIGVGDGPMAMLAELDAAKVIGQSDSTAATFGDLFRRIVRPGVLPGSDVGASPSNQAAAGGSESV